MHFILGKNGSDPNKLGGKAGALAALSGRDVLVPAWFAVAPEAALESLPEGPQEAFSSISNEIHWPDGLGLGAPIRDELVAAMETLCPHGEPVAVRSSAMDEDSNGASFAGQLTSFLFVPPVDVPDKVAAVWRSAFSENVLEYRRQHGLPPQSGPPAVLIQRMVDASVSGVAFGADPVTGNPDVSVVTSVYGLGTSLVSGECDADTHYIDRAGTITKRTIANKVHAHRAPVPGASGIRVEDVDPEQAVKPALTDELVLQIAELARDLSAHFGRPQDIEWAIADGQIYVLQSRPITTIPQRTPQNGILNIWDNSNIVESYNGVTTPLTFSFASYVYDEVYRQFCHVLRVPQRRIEENAAVFRNMLGLMQGRVYYNLLNWYRVLALLPGFQVNRGFMEQMMGVKSSLPPEVLDTSVVPDWRTRVVDSLYLVRSAFALIGHHLRLDATIRTFYARLETSLTVDRQTLVNMRAEELTAYYSTVEAKLLRRWDAPLINDFLAMIFFGLLGSLSEKWLGRKGLANDLLCRQEGLISVEPSRRMLRMAELAADADGFAQALCDGSLAEIREAMSHHSEFKQAFENYLDEFGDRCLEELKLESPTLHDDPMPLLRGVGHLAHRNAGQTSDREPAPEGDDPKDSAERLVAERLSPWSLKGRVFRYVLRHAKARVRDRENLRFERTRVFGLVRRIFVTLGRRLVDSGALDAPEDVFYLERHEIFGFIEGRATTISLRELVAVRKREFAAYREAPPLPSRFETYGIVGANAISSEQAPNEREDGEERSGIGCCAGIVRGKVRVVTDPRHERLQPGEILAARTTDPGWIVLFSAAAGLLVERGSLLSHSAIVSRELGIPSIVSIDGLTSWLNDGDEVELNGTTGIVRRLAHGSRAMNAARNGKSNSNGFTEICYAQCWEDADVLMGALDVQSGQTCLSVASAGDNTLSLVSKAPGRVIAVDHNPLQLHCLELRVAAYKALSHDGLLELVGSRPSTRRIELYRQCRSLLSPDARDFWDAHQGFVAAGIGTIGKFERYLALFRKRVLPWLLGRETIAALSQSGPPDWREAFFDRHFNNWRFRGVFRVFFSQFVMGRMGRHPDAFRFVEGSVADHLLARVRQALTVLDPAENPYVQWILTGHHSDALPHALREEHFDDIRTNLDCLELRCQTVEDCLKETGNDEVDWFNLSDIFEYLSEEDAAAVFDEIVRTGRSGGRVAYWNMLVPRSRPEHLSDNLQPLEEAAAELYDRDKAFFYNAFRLEGIR